MPVRVLRRLRLLASGLNREPGRSHVLNVGVDADPSSELAACVTNGAPPRKKRKAAELLTYRG